MSENNVFDILSDKILNKIENSSILGEIIDDDGLYCYIFDLIKMIDGIKIYSIQIVIEPDIDEDDVEDVDFTIKFKDIDIELIKPKMRLIIIVENYDNWFIKSPKILSFNKESIINSLEYCFDKLKQAKFNKYLCCLEYDEISNQINIDNLLCEYLMIDTDNKFKRRGDDCCVCMDKTITKTKCNHFICLPCFQQINNRKCPICRDDNTYKLQI